MIKTFILVLAMLLGTTLVKSQDNLRIATVKLAKKKHLRIIQQNEFDVAGVEFLKSRTTAKYLGASDRGALVDIVVNNEELDRLVSLGFSPVSIIKVRVKSKQQIKDVIAKRFDIVKINEYKKSRKVYMDIAVPLNEQYDAADELFSMGFNTKPFLLNSGGGKSPGTGSGGGLDQNYRNPAEIEAIVKKFHADFPRITRLVEIGKSHEGRSIWGLRITDKPNEQEVGEPAVLFNSMHHAREIITPEVSIDIIEYLLLNYRKSKRVNFWVNNLDIWVVPMLNVDGNAKVWAGNKFWRKNTRDGHGVDLNRNYPAKDWGACRGSSGSKWSDTYRGHAPGSEVETQVLMNLVSKIRPVFDISYHSYSNMVIYPLGCEGKRVADTKLIEGIGNHLGKLLDYSAGTGWDLLYSTDGGDIDWMYERWGVIPFVLELTSRSTGFHPPYSKRQPTVERNRKGWMYLLDRMFLSGVDLNAGKALAGIKFKVVEPASGKVLANYEAKSDGTLRFMLVPGTYNLVFEGKSNPISVTIKDKLVPLNVNL